MRVRHVKRYRRALLQELRIQAGSSVNGSMFRVATFLVLVLVLGFDGSAFAQVAMPDPTQIAGRALPAPELPTATVSARLVREALSTRSVGHEVKVTAGGATKTGKTDDTGRAAISKLPAGATATAEAVVDGEPLTSKPFEVPEQGGVRVILISGLQNAAARRDKEA